MIAFKRTGVNKKAIHLKNSARGIYQFYYKRFPFLFPRKGYNNIDLVYRHPYYDATMNSDNKIEQIEIKIAYLEDYIEKLNSVVLKQQKEIEYLKRTAEDMERRITDDSEEIQEEEKPPHY